MSKTARFGRDPVDIYQSFFFFSSSSFLNWCNIVKFYVYNIIIQLMYTMLLLLLSRFSGVRLCDHIDSSPPGSPVPGILQARTLEWVAISFSNAWQWKVKVKSLSHVRLLATPWTAAHQALPSMGFSRQEYWSGVPLPSLMYTICATKSFYPSPYSWPLTIIPHKNEIT